VSVVNAAIKRVIEANIQLTTDLQNDLNKNMAFKSTWGRALNMIGRLFLNAMTVMESRKNKAYRTSIWALA
jgi:hypothetical protein